MCYIYNIIKHHYMKLAYSIFLVLFVACSTNTKTKGTQAFDHETHYRPPIITVINNLHDTLKPKIIQLKNVPKPVIKKVGLPKVHQLPTSFLIKDTTKIINHPYAQGKGLFTTFTSDDGLAMDAISLGQGSILVDHKNNIWFATQGGGVSKYDGENFTSYTTDQGLANNFVRSIAQDQSGNIWLGTNGGVSKYNGESFITYTTNQGLANNYVSSITQDKKGNLWMGTAGGVSKYDGERFITYTTDQGLVNNTVFSITQDQKGNLWMGTAGGVSKYNDKKTNPCSKAKCKHNLEKKDDLKKHKMKISSSFTNFTTQQGLANNTVRSIIQDQSGNIWLGTAGGVSKYNEQKTIFCREGNCHHNLTVKEDIEKHKKNISQIFTNYTTDQGLANNYISSIIQGKNGNLWMGTYDGVSKFDGESFTNYTTDQGLINNTVRSITQDQNGNFWMGTYGGVSKYEGENFTSYTTDQGLANNYIFSILQGQSGNLWIGTDGGGISKYDGESFTTYTTQQGLANNYVLSMTQDQKGNLWMGTNGGGVSKYNGEITNSCREGDCNHNLRDKEDFEKHKKNISLTFTTYTTDQGLTNNYVFTITQDQSGNIWMGTNGGGVSKYNGETSNSCREGDCNHNLGIKEDVKKHKKNTSQNFTTYTTEQGLANNTVLSITQDQSGNLWMGTNGGGVSKYDGESFTTYTTQQGLANNYVFSITQDQSGNIWLGTNGGGVNIITKKEIEKLSNKTVSVNNHKVKFLTLNNTNGLPDNGVSAIRFNSKGDAIIGTNFGLYVLNSKEVKHVVATAENLKPIGKIGQVYNQSNGYPINDVNTASNNGVMCIDNQDMLWVGHGHNGITRVDIDTKYKNTVPPTIVINKIQLKNETICYYSLNKETDSLILSQQEITTYNKVLNSNERDSLQQLYQGVTFDGINKWYPLPKNLVLPYQYNALTFEFNAIETGRNHLVNYQYMLKGSNKEWDPITQKKETTYTNLAEGEYTFLLKAQSPWGIWSKPVEFKFTVLPPWFRTWWAYLSYVLLVVLGIWSLIRIQTKKLKQRQVELKIEVKNAIQEISQQKEQVEEAHKEITDSINYAERIQCSFLATDELLNDNLDDYFVLFKPKDVVSGDFYWADRLSNGDFVMVNADSNGHGVPGAIMSILNISSIELAIERGYLNPSSIFNNARQTIIKRLNNKGSEHGGKDGMNGSVICFDFKKLKMSYCTTQNPIWVIRNREIIRIKPTEIPVKKHGDNYLSLVSGEFNLQKGDQVYTLTDGFQNQFGGPNGKKFMVKRMRQFVLDNSHLPMAQQHQKLDKVLNNWMNTLEQVDDICVIGIKV